MTLNLSYMQSPEHQNSLLQELGTFDVSSVIANPQQYMSQDLVGSTGGYGQLSPLGRLDNMGGLVGGKGTGMFGDMSGMQKVGAGLGAVNSLANLYMGLSALSLAKKDFKFRKDVTETNLANQIKSYNTALSDRSRSRAHMEGQSSEQAQAYIDSNSLSRDRK